MASLAAALPSRQLARSARGRLSLVPRRTFFSNPSLRIQSSRSGNAQSDGVSYSAESMSEKDPLAKKNLPKVRNKNLAPARGSLGSGSIFDEGEDSPKITTSGRAPARRSDSAPEEEAKKGITVEPLDQRNRSTMDKVLNPYPNRRARWQRKMVIRSIRRRGRLTKEEQIMRTERESLVKSHWFKTSVKKLNPLARQISGKNIDDAILQMRFSKKKAAIDVKAHLEHAKNEAIVVHGMGLGGNQASGESGSDSSAESTTKASEKPTTIRLKTGSPKKIHDPTSIYIAQAWVNRGPYGMELDHRARGVINKLRPPYTGLSLLLKEEKTRIREWEDREAKALRQRKSKLWVPLPDRKISAQRQYYSW